MTSIAGAAPVRGGRGAEVAGLAGDCQHGGELDPQAALATAAARDDIDHAWRRERDSLDPGDIIGTQGGGRWRRAPRPAPRRRSARRTGPDWRRFAGARSPAAVRWCGSRRRPCRPPPAHGAIDPGRQRQASEAASIEVPPRSAVVWWSPGSARPCASASASAQASASASGPGAEPETDDDVHAAPPREAKDASASPIWVQPSGPAAPAGTRQRMLHRAGGRRRRRRGSRPDGPAASPSRPPRRRRSRL